jgi:hypothetical protein
MQLPPQLTAARLPVVLPPQSWYPVDQTDFRRHDIAIIGNEIHLQEG